MGVGGVDKIDGLAFLDQRADPVHLPPFKKLASDAFNHFIAARFVDDFGDDGRAAGRQFIQGRDIQVGVITHRQGARDRRRCHHQ